MRYSSVMRSSTSCAIGAVFSESKKYRRTCAWHAARRRLETFSTSLYPLYPSTSRTPLEPSSSAFGVAPERLSAKC